MGIKYTKLLYVFESRLEIARILTIIIRLIIYVQYLEESTDLARTIRASIKILRQYASCLRPKAVQGTSPLRPPLQESGLWNLY
jgi:hypothetical protein